MADSNNALSASLGSIIGYLGAEVAEPTVFERLLWPQRFYNYCTPWTVIRMAFMLPMGGPLHKAALETLDAFRRRGLYRGTQQGHMLGTAFFANLNTKYKIHNYHGTDADDEVRNGIWVTVLRHTSSLLVKSKPVAVVKSDAEANGGQPQLVRRTSQVVQHLKLSRAGQSEAQSLGTPIFSEEALPWHIFLALPASEFSALACAGIIIYLYQSYWFAAYLCVPLVLKLIALLVTVRREPMAGPSVSAEQKGTVLFQIFDYDHGFPMIEGPEDLVRSFFRHWGHPIRQSYQDRLREIAGIALVLAFVLFFPIGLLSMLWVSQPVQVVWLSYQMYTIVVMHIARLRGSSGGGRLEEGIAEQLSKGKKVALYSRAQGYVLAQLESTSVGRIAHGQEKVQEIVREHAKA